MNRKITGTTRAEGDESGTTVEMVGLNPMNDCECEEPKNELEIIYTINNHLYFYRDINRESAALFCKTLTEMYFDIITAMISSGLTTPTIEIHIKSSGGELTSALAMVNKMEEIKRGFGVVPIPMKIITHVEGEACSAGTLLSVVGSERTITEYSVMLIHDVLGGMQGKIGEVKNYVKNIELLSGIMKTIYIKHSKLTAEQLEDIVDKDIYFDATNCLELGLVDRIV